MPDNEVEKVINTIKAGIRAHLSIMLEGNPGQGKSQLVRSIADSMGYETLITIIGSQKDSTDITGFPVKVELTDDAGNHHVVGDYAIQKWQYTIMTKKKVFLFLDEFSNSPPPVQASMLALLNEREFPNGDKLPDETVVIGAMNPVATAANGFQLGLPVSNRLLLIPWEPSLRSWIDGFLVDWGHELSKEEQVWRRIIANFLERNPDMIYKLPDTKMEHDPTTFGANTITEKDIYTLAYPTNRSWTNVAKILPYCTNSVGNISRSIMTNALQGLIGYEACIKFMSYFEAISKKKQMIPPIKDIITDPSIVKWSRLDASQGQQIVSGLMKSAHDDNASVSGVINVFIFIANHRGTDLGTPYITELSRMASAQRLSDEIPKLINAYKSAGKMIA